MRLLALALLVQVGCVDVIDQERPAPLGQVVDDCVVPPPEGLAELGAPVSLELPAGSLWIFGETPLTAGGTIINAAALVASADAACAGQMTLLRDGTGVPTPIVPLSAAELLDNATRTDGRRLTLQPRGGFVDAGVGHLYYDAQLLGPGLFDALTLGTGVCTVTAPDAPCTRDDTLLFPGDTGWPTRGFPAGDGTALLYGCTHVAAFEDLCGVARVPIASVADPAAYEYFSWVHGWLRDRRQFTVAFEGTSVSPGENAFLGRTTVVLPDIWTSRIMIRLSDRPEDGFGAAEELFTAVTPDDFFISGGVEHAALRSEGDRVIAISYHTRSSGGPSGLHLVRYRFAP